MAPKSKPEAKPHSGKPKPRPQPQRAKTDQPKTHKAKSEKASKEDKWVPPHRPKITDWTQRASEETVLTTSQFPEIDASPKEERPRCYGVLKIVQSPKGRKVVLDACQIIQRDQMPYRVFIEEHFVKSREWDQIPEMIKICLKAEIRDVVPISFVYKVAPSRDYKDEITFKPNPRSIRLEKEIPEAF